MQNIVLQFEEILYPFAELSACILELIGILIIIFGSARALVRLVQALHKKTPFHIVTDLGKALSLALEFKMGAEIIKTVIIHNLEELSILGVVILIRALLSFIIHWEMKAEEKNNPSTENQKAAEKKESDA